MSRLLLLGLDCLTPQLVFDRWRNELPVLRSLINEGSYGLLRSCIPPITVPAWSCMLSSKDPGQLGIYGFRNRLNHSYDQMAIVTSKHVREDRVWDILGRHSKRSILIGVPGTYPPPAIEGLVIGDFLTPDKNATYTHPPALKEWIESVVPGYCFDVTDFRTDAKQRVLDQIFTMTTDRFRLCRELLTAPGRWDFAMLHEIGPDRIHHAFWAAMDPEHYNHVPNNPYQNSILEYYRHLDTEIGRLLEVIPSDTHVLVASDHGARCMKGGICINEWLLAKGYLALRSVPRSPTPLAKASVDWANTLAWGEGGYYARVFFNVRGREPEGKLEPDSYDSFGEQLRAELSALPDHTGQRLDTVVYRPGEIYRELRGIPPDLTVLFDNLAWRSVGTVGGQKIHVFDNDTGPDDANHAMDGVFIMKSASPSGPRGSLQGAGLYDIAPTILELLDIDPPSDMIGRSLLRGASKCPTPEA